MKRITVKILVGVLAAGAVGGGGYFLWKWHKKRKSENEPIEVEHIPFEAHKNTAPNDIPEISKEKFAKRLDTYVQSEGEKENFELYLSEMESPEDDEPDEEDDYDETDLDIPGHSMQNPAVDSPYLITAREFCNNRTYYDKVSLNYFAGDGVVADDRDEVMENANDILGDLQSAFSGPRASNVIYIRNEELEVDYEVSFVDGSYRKEVLNLDEEV